MTKLQQGTNLFKSLSACAKTYVTFKQVAKHPKDSKDYVSLGCLRLLSRLRLGKVLKKIFCFRKSLDWFKMRR